MTALATRRIGWSLLASGALTGCASGVHLNPYMPGVWLSIGLMWAGVVLVTRRCHRPYDWARDAH